MVDGRLRLTPDAAAGAGRPAAHGWDLTTMGAEEELFEEPDFEAAELGLSSEEIVSRILGFTVSFSAHATAHIDLVARSRGWLDADGRPTAEGRALIRALTSHDGRYGIYRLLS